MSLRGNNCEKHAWTKLYRMAAYDRAVVAACYDSNGRKCEMLNRVCHFDFTAPSNLLPSGVFLYLQPMAAPTGQP